jgi:rhombotail lipoprotein
MKNARFGLSILSIATAALTGCGGAAPPNRAPAAAVAVAPEPPVLTRSLYAKDSSGSLGETDLQTVLASPIDLQFPARVGVVPLAAPFDPAKKVSLGVRSVASRDLAAALRGHPDFSQVSDISTELPNGGGIEGLRVIAARYRMRYLLLFSERFEDDTHVNAWAWTYPTVIGMFVTPGVTVASRGVVQADLLDVRTGTILFSVVEPMAVSGQELMIGAARSHQKLQAAAASEAAKRLALKVSAQTNALVAFAEQAGHGDRRALKRILPAPVALDD